MARGHRPPRVSAEFDAGVRCTAAPGERPHSDVRAGTPRSRDCEAQRALKAYLEVLPGIGAAHDLHIWPLSTTETALTAHLYKPGQDGDDELLARISCDLREKFSVSHVTIQWERRGEPDAGPMDFPQTTSGD